MIWTIILGLLICLLCIAIVVVIYLLVNQKKANAIADKTEFERIKAFEKSQITKLDHDFLKNLNSFHLDNKNLIDEKPYLKNRKKAFVLSRELIEYLIGNIKQLKRLVKLLQVDIKVVFLYNKSLSSVRDTKVVFDLNGFFNKSQTDKQKYKIEFDRQLEAIKKEYIQIQKKEIIQAIQLEINSKQLTKLYELILVLEELQKSLIKNKKAKITSSLIKQQQKKVLEKTSKELSANLGIVNLPQQIYLDLNVLRCRYSSYQNIYLHSIEASIIAKNIANAIYINEDLAKKAALFHDIGKAYDYNENTYEADHVEAGIHTVSGWKIDPKQKAVISKTIELSHMRLKEAKDINIVYSEVSKIADKISASRIATRKDEHFLSTVLLNKLKDYFFDIKQFQTVEFKPNLSSSAKSYVAYFLINKKDELNKLFEQIQTKIDLINNNNEDKNIDKRRFNLYVEIFYTSSSNTEPDYKKMFNNLFL